MDHFWQNPHKECLDNCYRGYVEVRATMPAKVRLILKAVQESRSNLASGLIGATYYSGEWEQLNYPGEWPHCGSVTIAEFRNGIPEVGSLRL